MVPTGIEGADVNVELDIEFDGPKGTHPAGTISLTGAPSETPEHVGLVGHESVVLFRKLISPLVTVMTVIL